jgi:cell division septal protein FtsQ
LSRSREDYENASLFIQDQLRRRRLKRRLVLALILTVLAGGIIFTLSWFQVRYVTVEGSTHYTDEEIRQYATSGFLGSNSLALSLLYKNRTFNNVPFIESMEVEVVSRDTIHVTVYEKSIAGCVNYLGRYMYFDRNGMVVESSEELMDGVPEVTGLAYDHIALNEKLPVEDETIFARILVLTQLMDKYELSAQRIYVSSSGKLSAYFDDVCVNLGEDEYMDEKMSNLSKILPSLEGKSGTIDMSEYTPDTDLITFTEK